MSPRTPPETPTSFERNMAIESEKLTPKAGTSDGSLKEGNSKNTVPVNINAIKESQEEIQVAATQPTGGISADEVIVSDSCTVDNDAEGRHAKDQTHGITVPAEPLNWVEFESRYKDAISKRTREEETLLNEFESLSGAFLIWSQASAKFDNERAWKRFKTRVNHVQHSEQSLAEKKEHYRKVVTAFQTAVDLLKRAAFDDRLPSQLTRCPVDDQYGEEDIGEDDLGYYNDGVKRTLTDEQIAIFRHSEIEALLRERRRSEETQEGATKESFKTGPGDAGSEDGEVAEEIIVAPAKVAQSSSMISSTLTSEQPLSKKARKAQKAKEMGYFKQKIKPDLRKRTWDKVDKALGDLDYDEEVNESAPAIFHASQRRRITYDED
ncbi:hypothetical protein B7494_g8063 [Chlorociboria aeruginascens]|nr:hypothetical protein B7494_g8063 [Chlorociboria aeruginascens]